MSELQTEQPQKAARGEAASTIKPSRRDRLRAQEATQGDNNAEPSNSDSSQSVGDILANSSGEKAEKISDKANDKGTDQPDSNKQAEPEGDAPARKTIKDIAAALDIAPKDLYNVSVPMGDAEGNDRTIGELKDFYRHHEKDVERIKTIDREEVQLRTERAGAIRDLELLVKHLPPQALSREYLAAVQQQAGQLAKRETQRLVQAMPDLADPAVFMAARADMNNIATKYGLTEHDVANVMDHRWIMALRDLAQLSGMKEKASALKPDQKNRESRPVAVKPESLKTAQQNATLAKAKAGDRGAQQKAVLDLISRG